MCVGVAPQRHKATRPGPVHPALGPACRSTEWETDRMSAPPRLPVHIGDYLKKTPPIGRASWEHHGIYLIALTIAWNVPGCRLPADHNWLAMHFGCTVSEYQERVLPVLAAYFKKRGGFLYQSRLTEERKYVEIHSKKQAARAKSRWDKEKDESRGTTGTMPDFSRGNAPIPIPPPIQEVRKKEGIFSKSLVGRNGSGNGHVTIKDPSERLARFQKKIAEAIPRDGWLTVVAANDPKAPGHANAVEICKLTAKRLGKGWPTQWPAD